MKIQNKCLVMSATQISYLYDFFILRPFFEQSRVQTIHYSLTEKQTCLRSRVDDLHAQEESYCGKTKYSDLGIKINMETTCLKCIQGIYRFLSKCRKLTYNSKKYIVFSTVMSTNYIKMKGTAQGAECSSSD